MDHNAVVDRILGFSRLAVVGLSSDPYKPSNGVARTLIGHGYEVIPVNPHESEVLGRSCYPSLADIPDPIDAVVVFRRPEFLEGVAKEAAEAGAKALWLQSGLTSKAARKIANEAGMDYVENRCIGVDADLRPRATVQTPPPPN